MRLINSASLALAAFFIALASGVAQGFSFDFGDDNYPGRFGGYGQPAPRYYYPQMNDFDRSRMVDNRQEQMQRHVSTMSRLSDLLSGRYGFDRTQAIRLARKIERQAGWAMTQNFHPGAVVAFDSRTTRSLWGNEDMFRANALALQNAARSLAEELEKAPTREQGAVFLRSRRQQGDFEDKAVAVSPEIWQKYNQLSNTCHACHRNFRSPFD